MTVPVEAWLEPATIDEACTLLADEAYESIPLAGGTAVSLMLKMGFLDPERLVSLAHLADLSGIEVDGNAVVIGAGATLSEVAEHAEVRRRLPSLAHACASVGNIRVRNVATLGGNVAEADYASDPPSVLVSLGATCVIQGPSGQRQAPVDEVISGHYTTTLEPGELLTAVTVPAPPGRRATYLKYVTRSSEDRPCLGVAARVDLADEPDDADPTIAGLDVVVAAVASTPQRVPAATAAELGRPLDDRVGDRLATAYTEAIDPIEDARASSWYRREMIGVFVRRAVRALVDPGGVDG